MKACVSVNPHTPVHLLQEVLPMLDMVLVMSVNPGFGGQKFIENTYNKVSELRAMAEDVNENLMIQVDGGVNPANAGDLKEAGADVLVAGNAVFRADDPEGVIKALKAV